MTNDDLVVLARDFVNADDRVRVMQQEQSRTGRIQPEFNAAYQDAVTLTNQVAVACELETMGVAHQRLKDFFKAYTDFGAFLYEESKRTATTGQVPDRSRRKELDLLSRRTEKKLRQALLRSS